MKNNFIDERLLIIIESKGSSNINRGDKTRGKQDKLKAGQTSMKLYNANNAWNSRGYSYGRVDQLRGGKQYSNEWTSLWSLFVPLSREEQARIVAAEIALRENVRGKLKGRKGGGKVEDVR